MSVIRKRPSRYVAVGNAVARDGRLSFRARGLLVYMLSLPEDSQFSAPRLAEQGSEGRAAILSALKELRVCGYYRSARANAGDGRFITVTEVSSEPVPEWLSTDAGGTSSIVQESASGEPPETTSSIVRKPGAGNRPSKDKNEERKTKDLTDIPSGISAQTLVGEWLDHCEARPPSRVIGHVSKEIKILLEDDKIDPDVVRRGLAEWHHRRFNPSALASVVSEVLLGPGSRRSRADRALSEGASLIARLQAKEAAAGISGSATPKAVGS